MRVFALLTTALFLGCSSTPSPGADSGTDANNSDSGGNPDGANPDGASPDGASPDGGGGEYCPAGYTLTPFLSDTATTHTYAKADQVADPNKDYMAVLELDVPGRLVWHFNQTVAPLATNSFIFLALHHFFDGIAFHRVVPNFVAQGGDPNTLQTNRATWGEGGPGYSFADELNPPPTYAQYAVAMANSGPNTNGSQFFVCLVALPSLGPNYTHFGDLTEGMDVLPQIAQSPDTQGMTPPTTPTRMLDVHICEK